MHIPFPEQFGRWRVVLGGDALLHGDIVGCEPILQFLVATRSHHPYLLVRPGVHRDRSYEAGCQGRITGTNRRTDGGGRREAPRQDNDRGDSLNVKL